MKIGSQYTQRYKTGTTVVRFDFHAQVVRLEVKKPPSNMPPKPEVLISAKVWHQNFNLKPNVFDHGELEESVPGRIE